MVHSVKCSAYKQVDLCSDPNIQCKKTGCDLAQGKQRQENPGLIGHAVYLIRVNYWKAIDEDI